MSIIRIGSDETIDLNYSVSEDLTELEQFLTVTQDNTNKDLTNLGIDDISSFIFSPSSSDENGDEYVFDIKGESEDLIVQIYNTPENDYYETDNFDYQNGGMSIQTNNSRVYGYSAQDGYDYLMKDGSGFDFSHIEFELTEINNFEPDHANSITFGFYEATTSWQKMSNYFAVTFDGVTSSNEHSNSRENNIRIRSPDSLDTYYIGDNPGPFNIIVTIQDNTATAEIYESGTLSSTLTIDVSSVDFNNLPYYGYSSDQGDNSSGESELYSYGEEWRKP
jgi:hypothetical protein